MISIADKIFSNPDYNSHFENYPYELSDFQKHAIKTIVDGNHVLVTAHTGSGKTLPAEFAIKHFVGALGYGNMEHGMAKNESAELKTTLSNV